MLEYLNPVSKAKREAELDLNEMKFGERQLIHKKKQRKLDKLRKLEVKQPHGESSTLD